MNEVVLGRKEILFVVVVNVAVVSEACASMMSEVPPEVTSSVLNWIEALSPAKPGDPESIGESDAECRELVKLAASANT